MRANDNHKWVELLPSFLKHHNSQKVRDTDVVRSSVSQYNYVGLLSQLFKTSNPTAMSNISSSEHYPPEIAGLVWRFELGDKVLLARKADYSLKGAKNYFEKVSTRGSFGPRVHVVSRRMGKNNADLFITPVYQLEALPGTWFYEQELRLAVFAREASGEKERRLKELTERAARLRRLRAARLRLAKQSK